MEFFTQRLNKGGFMEENKMGVMPIETHYLNVPADHDLHARSGAL